MTGTPERPGALVPSGPRLPAKRPEPTKGPGYTGAAFGNRWNLGLLAGAAGISLATLSPLPLILAAGAELVYLGTVPGMRRFQRLVDSRRRHVRLAEAQALDGQLYAALSPNQQATFDGLRELRDRVRDAYRRLGGGTEGLADESVHKIDRLLSSFLRLLDQLNAYRRYLSATDRGRIERDLRELEAELREPQSGRLQDIKARRRDILIRRLDRFDRGEENREIISHQLAAIEDFLRLVHEQSLTLRDPQDVSKQLDTLAAEVEETEDTVRQMETFLQLQEEIDEALAAPARER